MLQPGRVINHFELVAPLGRGGMGEVWRVRDLKLDREVALKTLPEHLATDPEAVQRLEREARALAALNHPNVAQIYEVGESSAGEGLAPVRYLVMELVAGVSLQTRLKSGALSQREAVALGEQVAAALAAAHDRGVVHRDLKPANVMVTPDGQAKVLDFGLARFQPGRRPAGDTDVTQKLSDEGAVVGTVAYMAPEQIRGAACEAACDVWAFGCVLAEMVTGTRLFAGNTIPEIAAAVLAGDIDWKPIEAATERRLVRVLARCLDVEQSRRPTMPELVVELRAGVAGRRPWWRRVGLVAGAVAAMTAGAALLMVGTTRRPAPGAAGNGSGRLRVVLDRLRASGPGSDLLARRADALLVGGLAGAAELSVVTANQADVRIAGEAMQAGEGWTLHLQAFDQRQGAVLAVVDEPVAADRVGDALNRACAGVVDALQREHVCRELGRGDEFFGFLARRSGTLESIRAFREGVEASARSRYADAAEAFGRSLAADSSSWPAAMMLALTHKATGHFPEARAAIERARSLVARPQPAEAVAIEQAEALIAEENQRGLEALERARTVFPTSGYIAFRTAQAYRLQDRPGEAIPILEDLLRVGWRSDWSPVRETLVHCQLLDGLHEQALSFAAEGEQRFPMRYRYAYFSALALHRLGREADARETLRRAIRKYADYSSTDRLEMLDWTQYWAAQVRWPEERARQWQEILAEADRRLTEGSDDKEGAQTARVNALVGLGRCAEAIRAPLPSVSPDPYIAAQATLAQARALVCVGQGELARASLHRAAALWRRGGFPAVGALAYNIATAWCALGNLDEAGDWLLRARDQYGFDRLDLTLDPDLDALRRSRGIERYLGRPAK